MGGFLDCQVETCSGRQPVTGFAVNPHADGTQAGVNFSTTVKTRGGLFCKLPREPQWWVAPDVFPIHGTSLKTTGVAAVVWCADRSSTWC